MELRQTAQGVAANEALFEQALEQPVDVEFTLPDYCPDIARVLKCRVTPWVSSRSVEGSTLSIEGRASIALIYADTEGNLCSYAYESPFARTVDLGGAPEGGCSVHVQVGTAYMNCRPVTPRKLDVHGALTLKCRVVSRRLSDILTDLDSPDMQLLRGSAPATTPMAAAEKYMIVEEELELEEDKSSIRSLLRADARALSSECKIISNKAVVKGELLVEVLYCPEEGGRPEKLETSIPLSQIVDIEGVNESCDCEAALEVASLEVKPRTGVTGEARSVSLSAKVCVTVQAFCNADLPVIFDAYSTRFETTVEKKEIAFEKLICSVSESFLCKKTLEFSEGELSGVADVWCDSQVTSVRSEEQGLLIDGTVLICILGYGADGSPAYFERPVDFSYRHNMEEAPTCMRCEPQVEAVAAACTLSAGGKAEARVELHITAAVFNVTKVPLVTGVEVREDAPKQREEDLALLIYFAEAGERIWDIARRYNTSADEISMVNELDCEALPDKRMLLIPCV